MTAGPTLAPTYLSPAQTAELLGVSAHTLAVWRMKGIGPQWVKISRSVVRYGRSELERFISERSRAGASPAATDSR